MAKKVGKDVIDMTRTTKDVTEEHVQLRRKMINILNDLELGHNLEHVP